MTRESVLKVIVKELNIGREDAQLLATFLKENKDLNDFEFYEKLNKSFPWLELAFKYKYVSNLNKIESHLIFFKVLAIISIIIGVISVLILLN